MVFPLALVRRSLGSGPVEDSGLRKPGGDLVLEEGAERARRVGVVDVFHRAELGALFGAVCHAEVERGAGVPGFEHSLRSRGVAVGDQLDRHVGDVGEHPARLREQFAIRLAPAFGGDDRGDRQADLVARVRHFP